MRSYFLLALSGLLTISAVNSDPQENIKKPPKPSKVSTRQILIAVTSGVPPTPTSTQTQTPPAKSVLVQPGLPTKKTNNADNDPHRDEVKATSATSSVTQTAASVIAEHLNSKTIGKGLLLPTESIPVFKPDVPGNLLHLESTEPLVLKAAHIDNLKIFDRTEYGESKEHSGPRSKHFLRQIEQSHSPVGKDRSQSQSTIDVDETPYHEDDDVVDYMSHFGDQFEYLFSVVTRGVSNGYDYLSNKIFRPILSNADSWAQETHAGFMGYFDRLSSVFSKESESVGQKLFEAADAYSHRFFNLVHVRESDHPALAAKVTRIILAVCLSLTLVFIIFAIALHLQRTLVARAHEEAAKQVPVHESTPPEQLFFAMPYPTRSQQ